MQYIIKLKYITSLFTCQTSGNVHADSFMVTDKTLARIYRFVSDKPWRLKLFTELS